MVCVGTSLFKSSSSLRRASKRATERLALVRFGSHGVGSGGCGAQWDSARAGAAAAEVDIGDGRRRLYRLAHRLAIVAGAILRGDN